MRYIEDDYENDDYENLESAYNDLSKEYIDMKNKIERLLLEIEKGRIKTGALQNLVKDCIIMAEHGDYSNGVTNPGNPGIDEGNVSAGIYLDKLNNKAKELGVCIPKELHIGEKK